MRIEKIRRFIWGLDGFVLLVVGFCFYLFFFSAKAQLEYDRPGEWKGGRRGQRTSIPLPEADPWSSYGRLTGFPKDGERPLPPVEEVEGNGEEALDVSPLARKFELISYARIDPLSDEGMVILRPKAGGDDVTVLIGGTVPGTAWKLLAVEAGKAVFLNTKEDGVQAELEQTVKDLAVGGGRLVPPGPNGGGEPDGGAPSIPGRVSPGLDAVQISEGRWQMGPREEVYLSDDQRVEQIRRSVRAEPWKNPETGKYEGLKIRKLTQNSYIAQRGGQRGDILLSINGTPVTTREDVINYIRGPGKDEKQYVVKLLRNGQPRTLVYNRRK